MSSSSSSVPTGDVSTPVHVGHLDLRMHTRRYVSAQHSTAQHSRTTADANALYIPPPPYDVSLSAGDVRAASTDHLADGLQAAAVRHDAGERLGAVRAARQAQVQHRGAQMSGACLLLCIWLRSAPVCVCVLTYPFGRSGELVR